MSDIIWILTLVFLHELGHIIIAKKQGIYKGFSLIPTPHVKLTKPFTHASDYLGGIVLSIYSLPVYLLFSDLPWHYFFWFAIAIGALDIFVYYLMNFTDFEPEAE